MTIQYSVTLNNAKLDQVETVLGTAAILRIYTGAMPATCATAASGTKLTEDSLPSDWMAAASGAAKAKSGTWTLNGVAAGTAGYFRLLDSGLAATHMQGTVTATGGGGDMTLDNAVIAVSQVITVNTFTITAGNQ